MRPHVRPHGRFHALVVQYGVVAWEGALDRFYESIDTSGGPESCHPWTKSTQGKGYGQLNIQVFGGHNTAHKLMYELEIGEIPEGYEVDHTCHNNTDCEGGDDCPHRRCANPLHLEAVPPAVNGARANESRERGSFKPTCPQGHPYDESNTMWVTRKKRGKKINERQCKACNRDRVYKAKHGVERPADAMESLSRAGCPTCARGHAYDEQNTIHTATTGKRRCKKCERLNDRKAKWQKKNGAPLTWCTVDEIGQWYQGGQLVSAMDPWNSGGPPKHSRDILMKLIEADGGVDPLHNFDDHGDIGRGPLQARPSDQVGMELVQGVHRWEVSKALGITKLLVHIGERTEAGFAWS